MRSGAECTLHATRCFSCIVVIIYTKKNKEQLEQGVDKCHIFYFFLSDTVSMT